MEAKPLGGEIGDHLEGAWLLEEMGGSWDHMERIGSGEAGPGRSVELEYRRISGPDDEQGRG